MRARATQGEIYEADRHGSSRGVAFAALVGGATAAQAQSTLPPADDQRRQRRGPSTQAAPPGDIVITGSRIRRNPLDLDAPRVFVDQADIQKTGLNSINDVLQRLPSAGGGLNRKFNNSGNLGNPPDGGGVGAGSAEIDLRYLGSNRTLVLVDGLRFVNGASASGVPGSVDLNSIPESMIERVEVLQDGASAIYGSDAIAGVVNIITKQRQKGFVASAQLGDYLEQGDGFTQNYQLSWGNGSDGPRRSSSAAITSKQNGVLAGRPGDLRIPDPLRDELRLAAAAARASPLNGRFIGPASERSLTTTSRSDHRRARRRSAEFPATSSATADRFNFAPFNYIQIPLERYGGFGQRQARLRLDTSTSGQGALEPPQVEQPGRAVAVRHRPGRGQRADLLDTIIDRRHQPFNPFGVRSTSIPTDAAQTAIST